jgi:hypothetical protein
VEPFNLPNPSGRIMALGSTQPLTEMSTRNFPGGKGRPAHKADNLSPPSVSGLSRIDGNLHVFQPCGPPRTGAGIVLPFYLYYTWVCSFAFCVFVYWQFVPLNLARFTHSAGIVYTLDIPES